MPSPVVRFRIRNNTGHEELIRNAGGPSAVLSKALTRATTAEKPGWWSVWEYDDELYRVHRGDGPTFCVTVEVLA